MGTVADSLRVAAAEIGTVESPAGSNCQKYSSALGRPCEPWCADFQVWVARTAGVKLPSESAYTPTMAQGFKSLARWYTSPIPGDLAFFNFGSGIIRHVGIVESVSPSAVVTIEGNTSSGDAGSQDNGGGVYRRTRGRSLIVGFGRPNYAAPVIEVKPMFSPPLSVCAELDCPTGGVWLLAPDGAVYAFGGAPYLGGCNGKPYFVGRTAAQLRLIDGKYQIVATSGEAYGPGF